jgi:hypothetical protein
MTNKELYQDCSLNGIPVLPFVWGVMMFDLAIFITQQMLIAHSQVHKEWTDA